MQPAPHAFRLCGSFGFVLGCALAVVLARRGGLSPAVIGALAASGAATFFALAMAAKIASGRESLTYYHHQAAVLVVEALLLRWMGRPLLPYLDLVALGLGVFLASGRVGCLLAGCCHGIPFGHGVCYGRNYRNTGFPAHLADVRLFPVQAVEALWVAAIVAYGILLATSGAPAGSALGAYLVLYALGRFFLEFFRAGTDRPFYYEFSAAQWTSFLIATGAVCAEAAGVLPRSIWHAFVPVAMFAAAAAALAHPRLHLLLRLFAPRHLREFAEALHLAFRLAAADAAQTPVGPPTIHLASTSLGIAVSCGPLPPGPFPAWHFTVSRTGGALPPGSVETLSALVRQLARLPGPVHVVAGSAGAFHLLLPRTAAAPQIKPVR